MPKYYFWHYYATFYLTKEVELQYCCMIFIKHPKLSKLHIFILLFWLKYVIPLHTLSGAVPYNWEAVYFILNLNRNILWHIMNFVYVNTKTSLHVTRWFYLWDIDVLRRSSHACAEKWSQSESLSGDHLGLLEASSSLLSSLHLLMEELMPDVERYSGGLRI